MSRYELHLGNCLEVMKGMADNSVDSIVTDPPYGLSFMGKKWDYDVPAVEVWAECLRVLKPGGHLLAFAGTRTQHRMACNIEDAGFEIRDMIAWVYGSGFPKSLDVSKAIDKAAGAQRVSIGVGKGRTGPAAQPNGGSVMSDDSYQWPGDFDITAPATDAANQWAGWGTALKPALEPVTVARKPLIGTVAANVMAHGTGALNIDGCRVGWPDGKVPEIGTPGWGGPSKKLTAAPGQEGDTVERSQPNNAGRWPANLIHDGSDEVLAAFPDAPGQMAKVGPEHGDKKSVNVYGDYGPRENFRPRKDASKSAARFFYCAKTSKRERDEGMEGAASVDATEMVNRKAGSVGINTPAAGAGRTSGAKNNHPTVKPVEVMAYLLRLVTPPGGTPFDPFMGSGSTGKAAMREGFRFIGVEMDPDYFAIAERRIAWEADRA